ncbi:hypothetical protein MJO47_09340 [Desulfuromonas sp. KJ2020]|uniref:head-tail joining protein n=1 Tax=Desulfuromonas sp. KJ2020 TaxID=2919173 RepID=UPI0020A6F7DC|nr:hypothetical protein [Desulfuromonas sp. KJ2020]MCP3177301.1 hypothetical protein [Desulfuromonas sp. KJ2020]
MDFFRETDLDAMLDALGEDIILAGQQTKGIYESAFERVSIGSEGVESYSPKVTVKSSDITALGVVHGSQVITPDGILYVVGIEPERKDGKGMTVLILNEEDLI